jgi:Tol biopolymer transport system component
VTALQLGDAIITATSEGKRAQAAVSVAAGPEFGLMYDRVSASGDEIFYTDLRSGEQTRLNAGNVSSHPSPSPDGSRFVFAVAQRDLTTGQLMHDLFMVDRSGMNMRHLTSMAGVETEPVWSPDGTRIAFAGSQTIGGGQDSYVMNADGTGVVNVTPDTPLSWESSPAWSPDGRYIAFTSLEPIGGSHVWTRRADGSGDAARVAGATGTNDSHPTWSPDGATLAFSRMFAGGESDIMTIPFNGAIVTRIAVPGEQLEPAWSPDGRFLAFTGRVNGVSQIFTMRADGSGVRVRTSEGGRNAAWVRR